MEENKQKINNKQPPYKEKHKNWRSFMLITLLIFCLFISTLGYYFWQEQIRIKQKINSQQTQLTLIQNKIPALVSADFFNNIINSLKQQQELMQKNINYISETTKSLFAQKNITNIKLEITKIKVLSLIDQAAIIWKINKNISLTLKLLDEAIDFLQQSSFLEFKYLKNQLNVDRANLISLEQINRFLLIKQVEELQQLIKKIFINLKKNNNKKSFVINNENTSLKNLTIKDKLLAYFKNSITLKKKNLYNYEYIYNEKKDLIEYSFLLRLDNIKTLLVLTQIKIVIKEFAFITQDFAVFLNFYNYKDNKIIKYFDLITNNIEKLNVKWSYQLVSPKVFDF